MNVYKPLMISNLSHSIISKRMAALTSTGSLVEGTKPNLKKIREFVEPFTDVVTALSL